MSQKKKVIQTKKKVISPTKSKTNHPHVQSSDDDLMILGKTNYIWMGIGFAIMLLGFLLMSGGAMPDPNIWDDSIIYSARRTVFAPLVILIGLGVEIYAIFKD